MLPTSGYFRSNNCPFFEHGLCERPHCHFRHIKPDKPAMASAGQDSGQASASDGQADLFKLVREAIAQTQKEVDENIALYAVAPTPVKSFGHQLPPPMPAAPKAVSFDANRNNVRPATAASSSSAPPEYRPTPIAQLKRLQEGGTDSGKLEYDPSDSVASKTSSKTKSGYKPTPKIPYVPVGGGGSINSLSSVTYNPQIVANVQASYSASSGNSRYGDACFSDDDEEADLLAPAPKVVASAKPSSNESNEVDAPSNSFDLVNLIMKQSRQCEALIKKSSIVVRDHTVPDERPRKESSGSKSTVATLSVVSESSDGSTHRTTSSSSSKDDSKRSASDKRGSKTSKASTTPKVDSSVKNSSSAKCRKSSTSTTAKNESSKSRSATNGGTEKSSTKTLTKREPSSKSGSSTKVGDSSSTSRPKKETERRVSSDSSRLKESGDTSSKKHSSSKSGTSKKSSADHSSNKKSSSESKNGTKSSGSSGRHNHVADGKSRSGTLSGSGSDTAKRKDNRTSSSEEQVSSSSDGRAAKRSKVEIEAVPSRVILGSEGEAVLPASFDVNGVAISFETPIIDMPAFYKDDPHLSDMSSDEEVDTYDECLRIFNEYEQKPKSDIPETTERHHLLQAKMDSAGDPCPTGKKRIAHHSDQDPNAYRAKRQATSIRMNPSQVMNNRLLEMKRRIEENARNAASQNPSPPSSVSSTSSSFSSTVVTGASHKRVAHTAAVAAAAAARAKVAGKPGVVLAKPLPATATLATTATKGANRVAHTPSVTTLRRPIISVEFGSRIPMAIRQRYLNLIIDECLLIYDMEQDAFSRALSEEKTVYERSTNRTVYVNLVVNMIKRLRDERNGDLQPHFEDASAHPPLTSAGASGKKMTATPVPTTIKVSHEFNLGGKKAANVSYSIQRPKSKPADAPLSGARLYNALKEYVLQPNQIEDNGFPLAHDFDAGRAVIKKHDSKIVKCSDPNEKICTRCGHTFKITPKGVYLNDEDECFFHWGRAYKRRGAGGLETRYSCCQQGVHSDGCGTCNHHVVDCMDPDNLRGFIKTLPKTPPIDGNYGVFALDCEMCYTNMGMELTRVTVIGSDMKPVFETFVKPENEVVDYNTRFSGIKAEDLAPVTTTLRDVQAILLSKFNDQTIIIGHSLESDFKALKLIHKTVVDTSVVFPHKMGPPYKRALRTLMVEYLKKIIQNDVEGHDSQEDAASCMELMMWKLKNDLKMNL